MPLSSPPKASPGNHFYILRGGNGSGSINTKFRRFTTVEAASWIGDGSDALMHIENALYGAIIQAQIGGMYAVSYTDGSLSASSCAFGIALPGIDGTTSITGIPPACRLAMTQPNGFAIQTVTVVHRLMPGQWVAPVHDGNCDLTTNAVMFSVRRVGIL